jgi:hypothetical protein
MRLLTALALLVLLLTATPALADLDNLDSDTQTRGYGRIFGYVCAAAALVTILILAAHMIRGMAEEGRRGKKFSHMPEEVLDKKPPKKEELYLGEKVPDWKTSNRHAATMAALEFLARKDKWYRPKQLASVADQAFRKVKEAIELRLSKKIEDRVTASCLEELRTEMQTLRKDGELHLFGQLDIFDIQLVHMDAGGAKEKHTFTALLSVRSRDFIQDDKTGELLRGDRKTYVYQEFLRFRRAPERWLVERVRPSGDMDMILDAKNVMAKADLDKFAKDVEEELLREFVAK